MNMLDKLKAERLSARKEKDEIKSSLLTTLVGEIENLSKTDKNRMSDELVIATIKKFISNTEKTIEMRPNDKSKLELDLLTQYLPRQLTEDDIKSIINRENLTNIKDGMTHFKSNYQGLYDARLVSTIIKSL